MKSNKTLAYSSITAAVVLWGLSFVATKIALQQLPLFVLIFIRFFGAFSIFSIGYLYKKKFPHFTYQEHGKILLMSIFQPILYFYFETKGLNLTSAPKASLIIATVPVFVSILSWAVIKEKITWNKISGVFLSVAGIIALISRGIGFSWVFNDSIKGDLFIFGSVLSATFYTVMVRELAQKHSILHLTFMQLLYGTCFFLLLSGRELVQFNYIALSYNSIGAVLYLIVFCTLLAFIFYNFSLRHITATANSVFINCIPVVTILASQWVLKEQLTLPQYGGAAFVLLGVLLTNIPLKPVSVYGIFLKIPHYFLGRHKL